MALPRPGQVMPGSFWMLCLNHSADTETDTRLLRWMVQHIVDQAPLGLPACCWMKAQPAAACAAFSAAADAGMLSRRSVRAARKANAWKSSIALTRCGEGGPLDLRALRRVARHAEGG